MVGLAVARALAVAGREVIVLEAENAFGTGISSRHSEVIHAGIYYPPGSWRAQLCVRGKALLYDFCASHGVAHRRCGKLIVATAADELPALQVLMQQARANGVDDLVALSAAEATELEPALVCHAALLSPSTGIIDSHGLMLALLGRAEAHGAALALCSPVLGGQVGSQASVLEIGGQTPIRLRARSVVNAAGLDAPALARKLRGLPPASVPQDRLAKGSYFSLSGAAPFSRLVYPAPSASGHLGVHLTLDMGGQARFGPSFAWVEARDYGVDPAEADAFYAQVRRYWPALPDGALQPGYAGLRPKIHGPGQAAADFRIDGPSLHGVPGLVNLFGIESPGMTSSLAIAEQVVALLAAGAGGGLVGHRQRF